MGVRGDDAERMEGPEGGKRTRTGAEMEGRAFSDGEDVLGVKN